MYAAAGATALGPGCQLRAAAVSSRTGGRRDGSDLQSRHRPSALEGSSDQRFARRRRIRKRADYLRLQRVRNAKRSPHFVVVCVPGLHEDSRLGITVSRRVGNAVERNRVKRRVREFFRLNRERLQPTQDILVIARVGAKALGYREVEAELRNVFGIPEQG